MSSLYPERPLRVNDSTALFDLLRQARRRICLIHLLRVLPPSLLCAAVTAALTLLAGKWHKLFYSAAWVWIVPTLIPLAAGAAYALRTRLSALDVARQLERRAGLRERFSSAIEFQTQGLDLTLPFYAAQWADADRHAAQLNVQTLFPLRTGRTLAATVAAAMLIFMACRIPAPLLSLPLEAARSHQEGVTVQAAGLILQKRADDAIAEARRYDMAHTTQAAREAAGLALRMRHSQLDKRQSLVALQKLTQRFEQQLKQQDTQPAHALNADAGSPTISPAGSLSRPASNAAPSQQTNAFRPAQTQPPVRPGELPLDRQPPPPVQQAAQAAKSSKTALSSSTGEAAQRTQPPGRRGEQPRTQTASAKVTSTAGSLQIMRDAEGLRRMTQALQDTRRQISRSGMAGGGGRDPGQGVNGESQTVHNIPMSANKTPQLDSHGLQPKKQQGNTTTSAKKLSRLNASTRAAASLPDAHDGKTPSEQNNAMPTEAASASLPARTHTPYYTARETDTRQAENALSRENVPAAYKQQVKAYFDSINAPGRRRNDHE